jgi:hypothetical protein
MCAQWVCNPLKMWRKFPNLQSVSKWQVGKLALGAQGQSPMFSAMLRISPKKEKLHRKAEQAD